MKDRSDTTPISGLGERGLIRKVQNWCGPLPSGSFRRKASLEAGNGDDAFVVKLTSSRRLVFTTDTLVEGTHFKPNLFKGYLSEGRAWRSLGYKAMSVNLSDLAAMGGVQPLFCLITLGLDGDISVDTVDNLYKGMGELMRFYGFFTAGGDIIRSEKSIISVTIVGDLLSRKPILRSGAGIGEVLMATGPLGLSSAGLKILEKRVKPDENYVKILVGAHTRPEAKMKEGRILANEDTLATSLIDTSDDLMTSIEILGEKSRVGFEVFAGRIPVHPALLKFSKESMLSPYDFLLYGGEDYQLLFTVRPSKVARVLMKIPSAYAFGTVKPKSFGIKIIKNGKAFRLKDSRFRHF